MIKIGSLDVPFVFQGSELVYPDYIQDGLVLHYDFIGMSNSFENRGTAKDLSGNGNDGTLQNFNYTTESGYSRDGLKFDGVDDSLGTNYTVNTEEITIELAVTDFLEFSNSTLLKKDGVIDNRSYSIRKSVNSFRILIWENNVEGFKDIYVTASSKKVNTLSVVYSSGQIDIYVNGSLESSTNTEGIEINPSNEETMLEGQQLLNSVRIYNHPLTASEIAHNYAIEKERFGIV